MAVDSNIFNGPFGTSAAQIIQQLDIYEPRGMVPDTDDLTVAAANSAAIRAAWLAASTGRGMAKMPAGVYSITGELDTYSNLYATSYGCILRPVGWSDTGSIITNLVNSTSALSIQSEITLEGFTLDFDVYPTSPIGTAQTGSTTSTITLAAGDPATAATIIGRFIRLVAGTGASASVYAVTGYNPATKVATITGTWSGVSPDNTTVYQWGWNDNAMGFVAGASDIRLHDTKVVNMFSDMWNNGGGKGINFEQGVAFGEIDTVRVVGKTTSNAVAAVFLQGRSGTWTNGSNRNAVNIYAHGIFAENCGAAIAVGGADTSEDPTGDPLQETIVVDDVTFKNCGHLPSRFVTTDQQKSGPVLLFRAQNVQIANVQGYNESTYPGTTPGYPTDYSARVGYGLTGAIGAVIWGWGRNITLNNITYCGNADAFFRINRARAVGEDGSLSGEPTNVFDIKGTNLRHFNGTLGYVMAVDSTAGARVTNANLKANIEIDLSTSTTLSTGIVVDMNGFDNTRLNIYDRATDTRIQQNANEINDNGNTIASYPSGARQTMGVGSSTTAFLKGQFDETGINWPAANTMSIVMNATLRWWITGATFRGSSSTIIGFSAGVANAATTVGFSYGGTANHVALGNGGAADATGTLMLGVTSLVDGVAAPGATSGRAKIYVDTADGDLKVIFGDGTIKTIVVDT